MLYLATLGWPWLVGAVALGLAVGFATKPRGAGLFPHKGFAFLGAVVLSLLAAALFTEKFRGREALTLEFALLSSSAYFAAVLAGGAVKHPTLGRPMEKAKSPRAPAPAILIRGAGVVRSAEAADAPRARPAPATAPSDLSVATMSSAEKGPPGRRPEALDGPRAVGADDLKKIKGIGPKSEEKLNALGVYHFDQIADWSLDNARWIGAALAIPGRIERGKWIQQARALSAHQHPGSNS